MNKYHPLIRRLEAHRKPPIKKPIDYSKMRTKNLIRALKALRAKDLNPDWDYGAGPGHLETEKEERDETTAEIRRELASRHTPHPSKKERKLQRILAAQSCDGERKAKNR